MVGTYCGQHYHNNKNLETVFGRVLNNGNWDLSKAFFSNPNTMPRLYRKLGMPLVYLPIKISEDTLDSFQDPEEMFQEDGSTSVTAATGSQDDSTR